MVASFRARWDRGSGLRKRLRLVFVLMPTLAVMAWVLPTLGKGRFAQPLPRSSHGAESPLHEGAADSSPQRQLERRLSAKVTAALDSLLGAEHFRVILHADVRDDGGLGRLALHVVVDERALRHDATTDRYVIGDRSRSQIDSAFATAKEAAGFHSNRGDEASLTNLAFDHAGMIERDLAHRRAEDKRIWTLRAIRIAKILGVLAIGVVLNFIHRAMERGIGLRRNGDTTGPTDAMSSAGMLVLVAVLTAQGVRAQPPDTSADMEARVQQALERHVQQVLDGVAGVDRTRVTIQVDLTEGDGTGRPAVGAAREIAGGRRIHQLTAHLTVDPLAGAYNGATGEFFERPRDPAAIVKLASIAAKALRLRQDLGDWITASVESLENTRDRNRRDCHAMGWSHL